MTTTQRSTTAAALVLSLAAAGAPTATASQTDGNRATAANRAPATVYSRPDKSVIRVTTPDNGVVYSRPDKSLVRVAPSDDGGVAQAASVPQAVIRIQTPTSGFDWGDAGIGAAGGVAIAMLGVGGALVVSQRRPRRNRHTTTLG